MRQSRHGADDYKFDVFEDAAGKILPTDVHYNESAAARVEGLAFTACTAVVFSKSFARSQLFT